MSRLTRDQVQEIQGLIAQGEYVQAIKAVRLYTGLGLKEAKHAVVMYRDMGVFPNLLMPEDKPTIQELFIAHQKAEAEYFIAMMELLNGRR